MKGQIAGIKDSLRQDRGRPRFETRGNHFWDSSRRYSRQNSRGEYRNDNHRNSGYNRGMDRSRERSFSRNYHSNRTRSTSNSRSRSGSIASINNDRIRCYYCREYDHFARDCPTSGEERDMDQLQQMLNLEEEEQTHLLNSTQSNPVVNSRTSPLNLWMIGMAPLHIYLLNSKIGGLYKPQQAQCRTMLTREQDNYIYKKVETGEMINVNTIQWEMEQKEQLSKIDDKNGEINPYKELIVDNVEKIEPLMTQMEQWSILSNVLHYIQYDGHHTMNHNLSIRAMNKYKNIPETKEEKEFTKLDFASMPQKLCEEYLDIYEGIQSEIVNTTRFDENSDLSTTYLDRSDKARNDK